MKLAFDVISDLHLEKGDRLDWRNKATSVYCIVAGNISNDMGVVKETLAHLSKCYHGVFFIGGVSEYPDIYQTRPKTNEISRICRSTPRVIHLYNHVVVVDGIAIVAVHGWTQDPTIYCTTDRTPELIAEVLNDRLRLSDAQYLTATIERLQLHNDVKKIVIISATVPAEHFYFGSAPDHVYEYDPLTDVLDYDSEKKVKVWIYGNSPMTTDTIVDGVSYINNACYEQNPYWPKRFEVEI